jgi:hypothetical protein
VGPCAWLDVAHDDGAFLSAIEAEGIVPHTPVKRGAIRASDERGEARRRARRRMTQAGYALSQRVRRRVEQVIGWCKTVAGMARARFVPRARIEMDALVSGAAYNLIRMAKLAV